MSKYERNAVVPAVLLLLRRQDNYILLLRRYNTGFQDGQYTLPSGHVNRDEPPSLAVCREAYEEVGVTVFPQNLRLEQVVYRRGFRPSGTGFVKGTEKVDFIFSTEKWNGEPRNCEPNKCDDVRWVPRRDLPENTYPLVRRFLAAYPNHIPYEEAGYE